MLHGLTCTLDGSGVASDYAARLLASLGAVVERHPQPLYEDASPALAWAKSGAMALTGRADGPPLMCPVPLASCVEGVRIACAALTGMEKTTFPGAETLGERAALTGLTRQGDMAPGGACRLLRSADGWLAVNLPRDDDWALLPAWLETGGIADWESLAASLAGRLGAGLMDRARLLGLAVAEVAEVAEGAEGAGSDPAPATWCSLVTASPPRTGEEKQPLVVDLSSLWAGPLCSHLLQRAGARVVKVESLQRPDGARRGPAAFYDLLNHGKASVALDFTAPQGIARLRSLLERADIVIEGSRPRALRQLGICAEEMVAAVPGLTWLSINGHGRGEPQENWIAYGDDAGVAGRLSHLLHAATGEMLFCGDAIADPLTGWHAALAALASYRGGGGRLISLALADVVRHCAQFGLPADNGALRARWRAWQDSAAGAVRQPVPRQAAGPARPLGADTEALLAELGIAC